MLRQVLIRGVVVPFYRRYGGFLLFLFFMLFGIQPSFMDAIHSNYYIALGILTSPVFFIGALTVWMLYAILIVLFYRGLLQQPQYLHLFGLNELPGLHRFRMAAIITVQLWLPWLCYALLLVAAGIYSHHLLSLALVTFTLLTLIALSAYLLVFWLKRGLPTHQTKLRLRLPLPPGLFSFTFRFIANRQWLGLLLLKLAGFFGLYYFVKTDAALLDRRMLGLFYTTLLCGHGVLVFRNVLFLETELNEYRNLPLGLLRTTAAMFLLYLVILLPELYALKGLAFFQLDPWLFAAMAITGPSLLLLLHALVYAQPSNLQEYLQLVFGVWIVFIFFSLSWNWLAPAIALVVAVVLLAISWRNFEKDVTPSQD